MIMMIMTTTMMIMMMMMIQSTSSILSSTSLMDILPRNTVTVTVRYLTSDRKNNRILVIIDMSLLKPTINCLKNGVP